MNGVSTAESKAVVTFPPDAEAASLARRFVADTLVGAAAESLSDIAVLLVSELVTNAVVHAGSDVEVAVRLLPDSVRIEVVDRAPADLLRPSTPAQDSESGRGLMLVETLASAWGVEPLETGKAVWFEVPRLDRAEPIA